MPLTRYIGPRQHVSSLPAVGPIHRVAGMIRGLIHKNPCDNPYLYIYILYCIVTCHIVTVNEHNNDVSVLYHVNVICWHTMIVCLSYIVFIKLFIDCQQLISLHPKSKCSQRRFWVLSTHRKSRWNVISCRLHSRSSEYSGGWNQANQAMTQNSSSHNKALGWIELNHLILKYWRESNTV